MREHLRMQKMAQTLHSLQGRKMQCQKNADKWSKENEQFLKNIEELRTKVDENGARIKSDALAEAELDNEIKSLSVWRRKKRKLRVTVKGVLEVCSESCLPTEWSKRCCSLRICTEKSSCSSTGRRQSVHVPKRGEEQHWPQSIQGTTLQEVLKRNTEKVRRNRRKDRLRAWP